MLPSKIKISNYLPSFFILYKPRDIVSGDFYWIQQIIVEKLNKTQKITILAVADCTGHGVPGAFMSMIGNNLLLEIINTKHFYSPDMILNELRNGINSSLQQNESGSHEGMDIAVIAWIKDDNESILQYSGAMNPLYYVQENKFYEIKPDKMVIGGTSYYENVRYTLHTVILHNPTSIYLCTDGYQDQFGEQTKKKFMTKRLKDLLYEISNLPLSEQYNVLDTTFETWKGKEEQVDDVTIFGLRLV
jgi:serine phosphatase RsbU (regulator of sigma subunit)